MDNLWKKQDLNVYYNKLLYTDLNFICYSGVLRLKPQCVKLYSALTWLSSVSTPALLRKVMFLARKKRRKTQIESDDNIKMGTEKKRWCFPLVLKRNNFTALVLHSLIPGTMELNFLLWFGLALQIVGCSVLLVAIKCCRWYLDSVICTA